MSENDESASAHARAGELLAQVLGDDELAESVGPHLTCAETDNLASALLLLEQPQAARVLIAGHAGTDEGGDDHSPVVENETLMDLARKHVRYLAATLGVRVLDELNVPDDLSTEQPPNSVHATAADVTEGDWVQVWGFTAEDPWPTGQASFHQGTVVELDVYDGVAPYGASPVKFHFEDGRSVYAITGDAVAYIVREQA